MKVGNVIIALSLSALLGAIAVFGPTLMTTNVLQKGLFNTLYEAIGAVNSLGVLNIKIQVSLLILIGFIIGYFFETPFWAIGLASIVLLPLWSILDAEYSYKVLNLERHNLLPFEWIFYLFCSLPAMFGAWVGQYLRKWAVKTTKQKRNVV